MRRGFWAVGLMGLLACDINFNLNIPGLTQTPGNSESSNTCSLDSDCPQGHFCQTEVGEKNVCVLGSLNAHGNPVATVISWKVTQDGLKKLAIEWDALDGKGEKFLTQEEQVGAPEWLNGNGFEIEAEVAGPGAGEGFEAWALRLADGAMLEGSCRAEALSAERAKWTCNIPGGYLRTGMEGPFEVYVQAGENPQIPGAREEARQRTYNADTLPPLSLKATFVGNVVLGETFSICPDGATENGSGLHSMEILSITVAMVKNFSQDNLSRNGSCMDIYLPLDLEFSEAGNFIGLSVGARATDNVGNSFAAVVSYFQPRVGAAPGN